MRVLVTGGAGYIGAHTVARLVARGDFVLVVDDLSTGSAGRLQTVDLIQLDLASDQAPEVLANSLMHYEIDSIIHFAGKKKVDESIQRPSFYLQQNMGSLRNVVQAMESADISKIVFSSSAAVYGDAVAKVEETSPTHPLNPYGETKLLGEKLLTDFALTHHVSAASLRYFNVAGADSAELRDHEISNLIPIVIDALHRGKRPEVFGDDYPTGDGSCVRDFIHVSDLADAHLAVLDRLSTISGNRIYNVGTGNGYSVKEVIQEISSQMGIKNLPPTISPRRQGDPAEVVSVTTRIFEEVGWRAKFGLPEIVSSTISAMSN